MLGICHPCNGYEKGEGEESTYSALPACLCPCRYVNEFVPEAVFHTNCFIDVERPLTRLMAVRMGHSSYTGTVSRVAQ